MSYGETRRGLITTVFAAALIIILTAHHPEYSPPKQSRSAANNTEHLKEPEGIAVSHDAEEAIALYTYWLMVFTGFLAVSTVGLWIVTWLSSRKQSRDMIRSIAATRRTAHAAIQGNRLNKEIFLSTERPWVYADIVAAGPIILNKDGMKVTLALKIRNIGRSPAANVWINVRLIAPQICDKGIIYDPLDVQRGMIDQAVRRPINWGHTLFPQDSFVQQIGLSFNADEMKALTKECDFIMPLVVGCVDYEFIFERGHHHTGFIMDVRRSDEPRAISTMKNRSPSAIFPDEGDIPADQVRLYRWYGGGFTAT